MQIDILTLFPGIFKGIFEESLLKKAQQKGLLSVNIYNLRDYTTDKHKTADDASFGGGPGMVMKIEPVAKALEHLESNHLESLPAGRHGKILLMSPTGEKLTQQKAKELSKEKHLTILCGRYEGVDERVLNLVDEEISIGDYVLNGGELPAMVLVEAIARMLPGVVGDEESIKQDSFYDGLLDHPHYTRPEEFEGEKVPEVLLSGNHKEVDKWRRKESLKRTLFRRPDLLARAELNAEDKKLLEEIIKD